MRDVRHGPARRWVAACVAAAASMVVSAIPAAASQQTSAAGWSLRPAVTRVEPQSRPRAAFPQVEPTGAAFAQQAELTAADGATSDRFGYALHGTAISGNFAAVGAPYHQVGGKEGEGAVYVFSDASGSWQQIAELTPSVGAAGETFGGSLALSGTTLVVGATGYSTSGAVFVFSDASGSWKQTAMLANPHGFYGAAIGSTVGISGDTIVAGESGSVPVRGTNTQDSGVLVYSDSTGSWKFVTELTVSGVGLSSVAISGTTIAAAAPGESVGDKLNEGTVYIFTNREGTWAKSASIEPDNAAESDALGTCGMAMSGDNLAVGSPYANNVSGEIWVFHDSSGRGSRPPTWHRR